MKNNSLPIAPITILLFVALATSFEVAAEAAAETAAETDDSALEVLIHYEGAGTVDEDHGLLVFVFGEGNLSDPANPNLAARYLTENPATVRLQDLGVDEAWLVAAYDEIGGYGSGRLARSLRFLQRHAWRLSSSSSRPR